MEAECIPVINQRRGGGQPITAKALTRQRCRQGKPLCRQDGGKRSPLGTPDCFLAFPSFFFSYKICCSPLLCLFFLAVLPKACET